MTQFEFLSESEEATREWGRKLGQLFVEPLLIFLDGTLGAGKTRLVQAIAAGLDINPETVQSPTFTLMTIHQGRLPLVHVDAYRINTLDEVDQLGLDDWLDSGCVMLIEWASRIDAVLPAPDLRVTIEHVDNHFRKFRIEANSKDSMDVLRRVMGY